MNKKINDTITATRKKSDIQDYRTDMRFEIGSLSL